MRRPLILLALALALTAAIPAYVDSFDVRSVYEQQLVSHQRLKFTVDTHGSLFPYSGQIGWRILFSRWEIGSADPQYEYAAWSLPAQAADLSQEIWIIRPEGLTGLWHYRIDAVDAYRAPLATSGELTYTFTSPGEAETVYDRTLSCVAQSRYWSTSVGLTNPEDTPTTATLFFFETNGDPYPVIHGGNSLEIDIPAKGTWVSYLYQLLPGEFQGSIRIRSPAPLSWVTIVMEASSTTGMIREGVLNAENSQ